MQISQSIFGNDALVSIKLSICELDNIFYNKFLNSGNKPFHCFIIRLGHSYPQWWHFQFTIFSDWGSKLVGSSPTFFQNPSLSSNPGRPSQNLFSQRRLTEESRCPSDHLEMLEGVLYCLFLFRRAILEHTQSVILTSLDFAILIGINSDADGMLLSMILVNQQNNGLNMDNSTINGIYHSTAAPCMLSNWWQVPIHSLFFYWNKLAGASKMLQSSWDFWD